MRYDCTLIQLFTRHIQSNLTRTWLLGVPQGIFILNEEIWNRFPQQREIFQDTAPEREELETK